MWDKGKWKVDVLMASRQLVHLKVNGGNQAHWYLSAVYGSPHFAQRGQLWEDLQNLAIVIDGPWAAMGDFNAILSDHE